MGGSSGLHRYGTAYSRPSPTRIHVLCKKNHLLQPHRTAQSLDAPNRDSRERRQDSCRCWLLACPSRPRPSHRRRGVEWPVPYVSAPAPCVSGSPPRLVSRWPAPPRQPASGPPASRPPPGCPFADLLQPSAGEKSIPSALPLWPFVPLVFSKIPNPNFTVI